MSEPQAVELEGHLRCADPREAATVVEHLDEHVRLTRAEEGCLLFEVVPLPDGLTWTVHERFRDASAFGAHQARVKASRWGSATEGIRRDYRVTGLE